MYKTKKKRRQSDKHRYQHLAENIEGSPNKSHGLVPGAPRTGTGKMGGLAPAINCGGITPGTGSIGGGIIGRRGL